MSGLSPAKGVKCSHVEIRGRALQAETMIYEDSERPERTRNEKGTAGTGPSIV